ncbi:MAG: polysaccharide biosynthesis tyrosine autokinase [Lentisphaerae bacterium]|nr:polysaccharide biosynthesis tyrosine autokinase [Lentisphaerota bacterium]
MPQQEMIFSDYLRVLVKHKTTIILTMIAVTVSTYAWASRQKPEFKSTARIKIQKIQTFANMFDEFLISSGDPIQNYVHEITSQNVVSSAAATLKNDRHFVDEFKLAEAVSAVRIPSTDLIDITAKGPSPSASKAWCDAVVNAFITEHEKNTTANSKEEFDYIQNALSNKLSELRNINIYYGEQLGRAESESVEYDQTKILAERYVDAQIRLQTLRDTGNYTEDYPEIASLKQTISDISQRLKSVSEKGVKVKTVSHDNEQTKRVLEEMVSYLTKRLEEARISQTIKNERIIFLEPPRPGTEITTAKAYLTAVGTLLGLMLGIILAFIAENLDTSIRTLVEIENIFRLPILGIIPHFVPGEEMIPIKPEGFWDKLRYSDTIHTVTVFWRALNSSIHKRKRDSAGQTPGASTLIVPFSPRSPATEGYRAIRTNLQLAGQNNKVPATLVTSAGPAEGKSTTIANLAFAFAQAGKRTLLVGANMRRPSLYRTFGLARENGLSEILIGDSQWNSVVKDNRDLALGEKSDEGVATAPGTENLFFITCGGRTVQPAEWLSLPIFAVLVKEWEEAFDVVLIDGPPTLPVPDSVIMSAAIGHVVLVYQSGSTQRDSMLRAISLIKKAGATITGLVLNDIKATWSTSPDYFHYRGYYGRPEK